jgi:hypothetical protein
VIDFDMVAISIGGSFHPTGLSDATRIYGFFFLFWLFCDLSHGLLRKTNSVGGTKRKRVFLFSSCIRKFNADPFLFRADAGKIDGTIHRKNRP